jgi:phosphoribosylaminoimidazole-succinocarboxamide synthase
VHNFADDELSERYDIEVGTKFDEPIIEFVLKNSKKSLLTETHILALDYADEDQIEDMEDMAHRINDFLRGQFLAYDWRLYKFTLEFGQVDIAENPFDSDILLIDELSPEQFTIWDINKECYFASSEHAQSVESLSADYHELTQKMGLLDQPVHWMEATDANAS